MMTIWAAFCFTAFSIGFFIPVLADASPSATVSPAAVDNPNCEMTHDSLTLLVQMDDGQQHRLDYCSAYDRSTAQMIADKAGNSYVAVTFLSGHGTNASTEYLVIYRVSDRLIKRKQVLLSEPAGPDSRWVYSYEIIKPGRGGIILKMTLHQEGTNAVFLAAPPKSRTIRISQ
jgi:hypothetical protein